MTNDQLLQECSKYFIPSRQKECNEDVLYEINYHKLNP